MMSQASEAIMPEPTGRTYTVLLDFHGFTRRLAVPDPIPPVLAVPLARHLGPSLVGVNDTLEGPEEIFSGLTARFRHTATRLDGLPRYVCVGCPVCRLDALIQRVAHATAEAVLDTQAARRRAEAQERARELAERRAARPIKPRVRKPAARRAARRR